MELTPEQAAEFEAFQAFQASQKAAQEAEKPAEYYVHLADGQVVRLGQDDLNATGTHFDGIQIVATYKVGA